ncbi:MAG: hypothetical protein H0U98_00070 [Alphaproteobacteria bacterium]|nr:hypothetical protein [Alphaproteobacteria bacterium]
MSQDEPTGKALPVREQGEAEDHEQSRRQIAREVQDRRPVANMELIGRGDPVAILLARQQDVADRVEGNQRRDLRADIARMARQHAGSEKEVANDGDDIKRKEQQSRISPCGHF